MSAVPKIEDEIKSEGLLILGDVRYGDERIRLHCNDIETEYYVIRGTGRSIETYTFYDISSAKSEFNRGVEQIIYRMSTSDLSVYMQHHARRVKGTRENKEAKDV